MGEKEKLIEWLREGGSQPLFSQIAAQSLFQCQNCNECCRGEGYSLVDREDIKRIAISLGLDEVERTSSMMNISPPTLDGEFRRECLAYFLLTVSLEGLEDIDSQSESP
ncbi:MAG: hypothetical protein QG605_236 [Euryarchaeota archaeon]|nr:hypothetical protein [Euryarchaeota archaeon]